MKRFIVLVLFLIIVLLSTGNHAFAKTVAWGEFRINLVKGWSLEPVDKKTPHQLLISSEYKGRQAVIVLDKKATQALSRKEYNHWLENFAAQVKSQGFSNFRFVRRSNLPMLSIKKCPVILGEKDGLRHFNFVPYVNGKGTLYCRRS